MTVTDVLTVDSLTVQSGVINDDIRIDDLDNNTARTDRTQVGQLPPTSTPLPPPPPPEMRGRKICFVSVLTYCVYKC